MKIVTRLLLAVAAAFFFLPYGADAHAEEAAPAADFTCASVFTDGCVLQQNEPIVIYGESDSEGSAVYATLGDSFGEGIVKDGEWSITLAARAASLTPLTLTVYAGESAEHRVFENVLIGDVYLVIGQSNVEYSLGSAPDASLSGSDAVRFLSFSADDLKKLDGEDTNKPQADIPKSKKVWHGVSHGESVNASALGLFFADALFETGSGMTPIGVITLGFGGRELAAFVPREISKTMSGYDDESDIYNAFISPLLKYRARGVVWYQGEANAAYPAEYEEALVEFIEFLRTEKAQELYADLPFYIVELPPCFEPPAGEIDWQYINFGAVRSASGMVPSEVENVYICPTSDLWNDRAFKNSLHPQNKREIAQRLARIAAYTAWGIGNGSQIAPSVKSVTVSDDGRRADIVFDCHGESLSCAGELIGFDAIGGEWQKLDVKAEITGDNTLAVTADEKMYRVRYAPETDSVFGEDMNLSNLSGTPAAAFTVVLEEIPTPFLELLHVAAVRVIGIVYRNFAIFAVLAIALAAALAATIIRRRKKGAK